MGSPALRMRGRALSVPADVKGVEHSVFLAALRASGIPAPTPEYRFAPPRRWRFDYAWPDALLALEVEGGAFTRGRHTRGKGFIADMEKYSEAAVRGFAVVRVTPQQLATPYTLDLIRRGLSRPYQGTT